MNRSANRLVIVVMTLACVVGLVGLLRTPLLRAAGHLLVTDEPVERSDVIIVPNWTGTSGALEAADLVHGGASSRVGVLIDRSSHAEKELIRRGVLRAGENFLTNLLHGLGVEDVLVIQDSGNGTSAEGQSLPAWLARNGFQTAIVISTPDHSRRMRRILRRSFATGGVRAVVRTTRYSDFDPDAWWQSRGGVRTAVQEIQKLLLDVVQHPLS